MMIPILLGSSCTPADPDTFNPAYERILVQDDVYRPTDRELDDYEGWKTRGYPCGRHRW